VTFYTRFSCKYLHIVNLFFKSNWHIRLIVREKENNVKRQRTKTYFRIFDLKSRLDGPSPFLDIDISGSAAQLPATTTASSLPADWWTGLLAHRHKSTWATVPVGRWAVISFIKLFMMRGIWTVSYKYFTDNSTIKWVKERRTIPF